MGMMPNQMGSDDAASVLLKLSKNEKCEYFRKIKHLICCCPQGMESTTNFYPLLKLLFCFRETTQNSLFLFGLQRPGYLTAPLLTTDYNRTSDLHFCVTLHVLKMFVIIIITLVNVKILA